VGGSRFDGFNCYVDTPPTGTRLFVSGQNLYYTPVKSPMGTFTCPMAGSILRNGTCYVASAPNYTTPFVYSGNLYYTPLHPCPMDGSWYDGYNCFVTAVPNGSFPYVQRFDNDTYKLQYAAVPVR